MAVLQHTDAVPRRLLATAGRADLAVRLTNLTGVAVDLESRNVQRQHATARDDGRDAQRTSQDRGVRGGAALLGHQGEDLRRVETRGIGGREITRYQHRRRGQVGNAGGGQAQQLGHHPVADVLDVAGAFGHVTAGGLQCGDELRGGLVHRTSGRQRLVDDELLGRLDQGRVAGHRRRRLQNGAGLALDGLRALHQPLRDDLGRRADAGRFFFRIRRSRTQRGFRQGLCDPHHGTGSPAAADTDTAQPRARHGLDHTLPPGTDDSSV